jgi:hypothetical protein
MPQQPSIMPADNPHDAEPVDDFRLFAVVGTWTEADVIGATIKNALTQGCERVYLVDNQSSDDTVAVAVTAGAVLAESYATPLFDEQVKAVLLNATVARVSFAEDAAHIWWLYADADEFPHGPDGMTIREYLGGLDRRFRVVGSRVFNHFPHRSPQYVPGYHPLDFQPLCEEFRSPMCPSLHWKHPLQRFDRHGPFLTSSPGFHAVDRPPRPLYEPSRGIFTNHFQYRDEQTTRRRLELLCGDRPGGVGRSLLALAGQRDPQSVRRFRMLDAVYGGRWAEVDSLQPEGPLGVQPRPWPELVGTDDARVARWYSDVDRARALS